MRKFNYAAVKFLPLSDLLMNNGPNDIESNYDRITYSANDPGDDQSIIFYHVADKRGGGMYYNKRTGFFMTEFVEGFLSSPDRENFNESIDEWLFIYQGGHLLQFGAASIRDYQELEGGKKKKRSRSSRGKSLRK